MLFYDDLKTNPETFLKSVFVHIGIGTDIDWKQLPYQQKFNVNPDTSIPEQFRTMLEQQYCQEIENLYQRFGEKLANWRCNSN